MLVGDAFATSCPTAGTGTGKVFTDVERLCNVHIPRWLATPGMGADKIAAFYADPVRAAYHAHSAHKAFHLRSLTVDPGLTWTARRWTRFAVGVARGWLRRAGFVARMKRSAIREASRPPHVFPGFRRRSDPATAKMKDPGCDCSGVFVWRRARSHRGGMRQTSRQRRAA